MAKRRPATREERLEKKRAAERLRYQRIKNDAQKYAVQKEKEKQKYRRKKETGIVKIVKDMTPREQRKARKIWREKAVKRRRRLALQNISNAPITPPSSDSEAPRNLDGRGIAAKKKSERVRRLRYKIIKQKDREIAKLKTRVERYRKRLQRSKTPVGLTPNSKVNKLIDSPGSRPAIKKKLLFGEVLDRQLKQNFATLATDKEKKIFRRMISGPLVNKYGILRKEKAMKPVERRTTKLQLIDPKRRIRKDSLRIRLQRQVTNFFEDDSNSRVCPGKKDFVRRKGVRKTKRVLLDTLLNLHKKFKDREHVLISYAAFCNLRPFWVTFPRCDKRDTCLCVAHANIDLTLVGLSQAKIISVKNHQSLLSEICCDRYDEKCLSRECRNCERKVLRYNEFDNSVPITYKKWLSVTEEITDPKTKKLRKVTKYTKQIFQSSPREVIIQFESDLTKFLQHELNIWHQYGAMKTLKASLTEKDCLIHMDFSENYQTKFSEEIQSFHFGGSRLQVSLHTVVVYTRDPEKSEVRTNCYCTMSKNLAHSPAAIWAHLKPILTNLPASVENLHFLSDGPVTQYRNKTMFHLLATSLKDFFPNLAEFSWNYHEAGHGKGAPDGVGAVCKRTADGIVARGGDISSLDDLSIAIEKSCPNIKVIVIPDSEISEKEALVRGTEKYVKTFAGTLKVHQIVGNIFLPNTLRMKTLSCFCDLNCSHYKIGTLTCTPSRTQTRLHEQDVYDSESEPEIVPEPSTSSNESKLKNGDFLLVRFFLKKKSEFRYVAICTGVEEDDEIQVKFCKLSDKKGCLFKVKDEDVSFITRDQIVEILPTPNITLRGARMFYHFKTSVDVFEQA